MNSPTVRRRGRRSADLLAAVRQHSATMFGRCAQNHACPPPATTKEQRRWTIWHEEEDNSDIDSVMGSVTDMDLDDERDPSFPYPDGPGHSAASPQAIRIIWRTMRKARQLPLSCDLSDVESIRHLLPSYAIKMMYNKPLQTMLIILQEFTERQNTGLKEKLPLATRGEGKPLALQVDDETDNEFPARPTPRRGSSKTAMRAKVLRLPSCSAQVERIMIGLDRLRARRLEYAVQRPGNPPPRVRRRLAQPDDSLRPHKAGLSVVFYDKSWLLSLSTFQLQALASDIQAFPLDAFLQIIENLHIRYIAYVIPRSF
ncbi:uncharacterized protein PGTG_09738 [Puccinia graminis f. sp. tritici CRL 75-36-700-3]|uniref:Uncharacterized protein n=1 Tax=Puccinia graminis f. sp. tritici (strain CRL 75-36-700-3 / race SCCL) TaxID=418459 RepID=E3KIA0_PUCGT|nr:uncharacterized protein PGTG_09738 [Puccinia graminis f. sp. tritici CRL 75-36-700-3]EFP84025.2 hypothetical protein PGTG_09738 [Puccinia graminis f. sp. tritici CRL 75-36-700-3]